MAEEGNAEEKKALDEKIITALSLDSRTGIDAISKGLGETRSFVYSAMKRLEEERKIHYIPQINIEKIQRNEFLALSRSMHKRSIQKSLPMDLGFQEYIALIEFNDRVPTDKEVLHAIEGTFAPQYVARMSGSCNLFMYLVARNSFGMSAFLYSFMEKLKEYDAVARMQSIARTFGYFPIRDTLIDQMQIQHGHKRVLKALNKGIRRRFSDIGKELGMPGPSVAFDYRRLLDLGIITRPTLYMEKPREQVMKLFSFAIVNRKKFYKNRDRWLLDFVGKHLRNYVFICNIASPEGILMLTRFNDLLEAENFRFSLEKFNLGIKMGESTMINSIVGNLGVRNFEPSETMQYQYLEAEGMVPKVHTKLGTELELTELEQKIKYF